jgi:hypothetical protein
MPSHESESEFIAKAVAKAAAKAKAKYRARKPVGRPSLALETMIIVAYAMQRMPLGDLTQGAVMRATRDLYKKLREACHDDPECIAPSQHVLRQYVKAYLLYRTKGAAALVDFPLHFRQSIDRLPGWIQCDALVGFAGTLPNGPTIIGDQQAPALTKRIRAIPSLSK